MQNQVKLIILDPNMEYRTDEECSDYLKNQWYDEKHGIDINNCHPPLVGQQPYCSKFWRHLFLSANKVSKETKILLIYGNENDPYNLDCYQVYKKLPNINAIGYIDEGCAAIFNFKGSSLSDYQQKVNHRKYLRSQEIDDKYEGTYILPKLGLVWKSLELFNVKKSEVLLISDRSELLANAKAEGFNAKTFSEWSLSALISRVSRYFN